MSQPEKFWDRAASTYDQEEKKDKQAFARTIAITQKYLKASDVILDYGCATGLIANEIAGDVKAIHGIDISAKMIEIATRKAAEREIENVDYAQSTLFDEQYRRESYDVILAFSILHLLEDTQQVVQRINELLKPGGLFISATACMGEKTVLNRLLSLGLFLPAQIGLVPRVRVFNIAELEDSIICAGFQIVETVRLHHSPTSYFVVAKKI